MLSSIRLGVMVLLLAAVVRPDAAFGNDVSERASSGSKNKKNETSADCNKPAVIEEGCKVIRKKPNKGSSKTQTQALKKAS